ncbi:uncharacterized protein Z518_07169 [Rhinocladiella mackenziei CBS 650.93]|uniref:Zn(2)-C6 fungal-type domain-containing protein n=1 Tax=Rhinocladiella mackenziei CBS 650.93 TaxID=1442369 RepID=A0A0D2IK55_9EURO|nr:uncharacterized protein Z518_07169 [Rhinocladiella mackenziei CBS 650.93]KIX03616.1 hypothetical protein Z518_07169 [Rhinocladiella mackenziei CBS 650.93]
MATRSRHGCIDCKKAKVKCDEIHPFCGTCKRRGRQCAGYNQITKAQKTRDAPTPRPTTTQMANSASSPDATPVAIEYAINDAAFHSSPGFSPSSTAAPFSPISNDFALAPATPILKTVATIPPGTIHPADEPFIELYFMRHPGELVFGSEFVNEMNSSVLKVFQNSPLAVGDSLSAIGEAYLRDGSLPILVPVPNRKARILARLRSMDNLGVSLELLLTIMLGLCAIELVDATAHQQPVTSVPALLDNLAMMLDHHLRKGFELTQLAKYFVRALARQDMMLSLTRFHRPRIPTSYWLDDYSRQHADRFMGYTGTLMPLLAELCSLAEDFRASVADSITNNGATDLSFPMPLHDLLDRASQIQLKLEQWHPTVDPTLSFQSSRKFLMHANAYRSASLLYLHRLLHPPGTSVDADQAALLKAYEVMVHTTACDDDMKMSLWPIFLAACEVNTEPDRLSASQMLSSICRGRKTVNAMRTRSFVINRVWSARDAGLDWNWMTLAQRYPNELLPI